MNAITHAQAQAHAAAFVDGNPAPYQVRYIKPSYKTMIEVLRQWHDDIKDEAEMSYLPVNLEDVADKLESAHRWANEAREQAAVEGPDQSWIRRQDAVGRTA